MNHFGESRIPISQVLNFIDLVFNFSVSHAGLMTGSYFIVLSISPSLCSCIVLKCNLMVESLLISLCQMSLLLFANWALVLKLQARCLDEVPLSEILWGEACCQFIKDGSWIIPSPVPSQMRRLEQGLAIYAVSLFKAEVWEQVENKLRTKSEASSQTFWVINIYSQINSLKLYHRSLAFVILSVTDLHSDVCDLLGVDIVCSWFLESWVEEID